MKYLQVIESAYRGSVEEQDDTIIWLSLAMKGAGAELDVLLRGNAVNYILTQQNASGLTLGQWKQTQPAYIYQELQKLANQGVTIYVIEEDIYKRGLTEVPAIPVEPVAEKQLPDLYEQYDRVSYW